MRSWAVYIPMIVSAIDLTEMLLLRHLPFSVTYRTSALVRPTKVTHEHLNIDPSRAALMSKAHELHLSFQASLWVLWLLVGFAGRVQNLMHQADQTLCFRLTR